MTITLEENETISSEILQLLQAFDVAIKNTTKQNILVLTEWQQNMYQLFNQALCINAIPEIKRFVINNNLRGLGQSLLCLYMSDKFNYPIIVYTITQKAAILDMAKKYGLNCEIIIYGTRGLIIEGTFILDGLNISDYQHLKESTNWNLIGFTC